MQEKPTIGIYAGAVPSTTFIERLVYGLAKSGLKVFHFGLKSGEYNYPDNIVPVVYSKSAVSKLFFYIGVWTRLMLFKSAEKQKLDAILKSRQKNSFNDKLRAYPILLKQADIIHIQWAKTIEDWMWVQDFGMKLVLSLRGAHINYSPLADDKLAESYSKHFPNIDGFHAVSKAISLEAQKYGANPNRIKVVYSGLEVPNLNPKYTRLNRPLSILSVGRDHWKKGYSYALDAMAILKELGIEVSYTIIGAAGSVELLYQIKDLNLESQVQLLPQLAFEEVQLKMKESDLVLLSSVEEGVANVVLESMAIGTAVISTDCGGMTEVLSDGFNGFVVPVRDAEAIARKIELVYNMELEAITEIVKEAHLTISRNHSLEEMIDGMVGLYEAIQMKTNKEDE